MRSLWVLLLLAAAFAGCPQEKPPCNLATCPDGCCTSAGECRPGNDKAACGTGALFCRTCDETDTCAEKRCDLVRPDAGSCPTGFHRCVTGENTVSCAADDDVATCGSRCRPCPATNGIATCSAGACGVTCRPGTHVCGSTCVDDTAVNSCGTRCGPCAFPMNSIPKCTNRDCDFECDNGYHRCGDQCLRDTAPASCGSRCIACPAPANGTATCTTELACDFVCNTGFHRCGMACVSDTAPETCGSSCVPCPGTANGAAACVTGQCDVTCTTGFNRCNGVCAPATSTTACGPSCSTCTAPDGGAPVCTNSACAYTCATGFNPCNGECASATDVKACGATCTRCAEGVPGSVPTCDGTSCSTTCAAGNTRCGGATGSCVGEGVAAACGAGCTTCPAGSVLERATCTSGTCGTACIDTCNAACVDRQRDPAHCGACGVSCGAGACIGGQCRATCTNGVFFSGVAEVLPHAFTPGTAPRFWAVDVTGDSRLDLLATGGTTRFTFVNAGNARFQPATIADAGTTLLPLDTADFTLDGRADLIAGDARALWLVQQTAAGFSTPLVLFTNGQNGIVLASDFTGDGRADLLRVPQIGNLNADLWVNQSADGGAPFSQTRNAAPNLQLADFARAGDLTNDSRSDLVTSQAGQLRVFVTSGANAFTQVMPPPPVQNGVIGLAVAELTRDANRDVATITPSAVFVLAGNGSGGLAAPVLAANAGSTLAAIEAADLDGDGFTDLALGTGRGLEVLWSTGAGTFSAPEVYEVDGFTPASAASGLQLVDLTGDGRLDVVLFNGLVRPVLIRNTATGRGFERTVKTALTNSEFLLAGRVDGDSRDDLIVSRRASVVSMQPIATQTRVLRANGAGGFTVGPEDPLTRPEALADFDQDGNVDVLRLDCPSPMLPDGGFSTTPVPCFARVEFGAASFRFGVDSVSLALDVFATEVQLRAADFDADGRADVLVRTNAGLSLFRNLGMRQFAAPTLTPFLPAVQDLAVVDVDRDGRNDVVVLANANAPRAVYPLLSRGTGFVLAPRVANFDFDTGLVAGFVTNDSYADIAGGSGVLMTGNGTAGFVRGTDWKPGPTPAGAAFLVDTDGDGRGEVVNRQFNSTVLATPDVLPRGFSGRVERFADVTGDGVPDWVQLTPTDVVVGVGRCR
ncbi:MAG: FG-GAP-like repeat-containing protein [Myxococcales bacterium]|nr:FG-GAP-like repeat-containing protein [Myxococcales bacterium]